MNPGLLQPQFIPLPATYQMWQSTKRLYCGEMHACILEVLLGCKEVNYFSAWFLKALKV